MTEKHYQIIIDNHKIAWAAYLNDILLSSNRYHSANHTEYPINQYIVKGKNKLRLNLSINPKWQERLGEQFATIVIQEHVGEKDHLIPRGICKIEWKFNDDALFPVNLTKEFDVEPPYGNWFWLDATPLSDETIDVPGLHEYIRTVHRILDAKDYESLAPFLEIKSRELAQAFYIPIEERFSDQERFFTRDLFSHPSWKLRPLDPHSYMIDYMAGGKLVKIVCKDGKSPISSEPLDDAIFQLGLVLAFKNNAWVLCR